MEDAQALATSADAAEQSDWLEEALAQTEASAARALDAAAQLSRTLRRMRGSCHPRP